MSNRNRNAGCSLERSIAQRINKLILGKEVSGTELRKIDDSSFDILPKLGTTRELSRAKDAKKVDICSVNPQRDNEFPYLVQAKSLAVASAPYALLLSEIKEKNKGSKHIPVVFHQQTKKKGEKFYVQDEFACLYLEDFLKLMIELAELRYNFKQQEHFKGD